MPLIDLPGLGHFKDRENAMIAEDFSASKAYAAGDYCYYNGTLYKFKTAHAAGAWTIADVEAAKLAHDVSDLKESVNYINPLILDSVGIEPGAINTAGALLDNANRVRTIGYIKGNFKVTVPSGIIVFRVFYYNENTLAFDSFVEVNAQTATIGKTGCIAKIVFAKTNTSSAITPNDVNSFLYNSLYKMNEKINSFYANTNSLFSNVGQLVQVEGELGGFLNEEQDTLLTTGFIPVVGGETITVRGRGSDAATALIVYYDENYFPISSIKGASYNDTEVTLSVPQNAKYCRVCKDISKTGYINCLATRRENSFDKEEIIFQYYAQAVETQTALPDEMLATSQSFVPANVPNFVYDLYDTLMAQYPNYITKLECNSDTGIGTDSSYKLYMYKFVPPIIKQTASGTKGKAPKKALIVSGAHSELAAIYGLYLVMKYICEHGNDTAELSEFRYGYEIDVIPVVNPYGVANGLSVDENGVDFERNFRTNDWQTAGTAGQKGYSGTAFLSEINTQIVNHYIINGDYSLFVDCHNFYNASERTLSWIVPPLGETYGDSIYKMGCEHVKSMTGLWKKQFPTTFPNDNYIFGRVTIPLENMRSGTGYVGLPAREFSHYKLIAFTVESCETCSYINGSYSTTQYERGTADIMTRVTENILNALLTAISGIT